MNISKKRISCYCMLAIFSSLSLISLTLLFFFRTSLHTENQEKKLLIETSFRLFQLRADSYMKQPLQTGVGGYTNDDIISYNIGPIHFYDGGCSNQSNQQIDTSSLMQYMPLMSKNKSGIINTRGNVYYYIFWERNNANKYVYLFDFNRYNSLLGEFTHTYESRISMSHDDSLLSVSSLGKIGSDDLYFFVNTSVRLTHILPYIFLFNLVGVLICIGVSCLFSAFYRKMLCEFEIEKKLLFSKGGDAKKHIFFTEKEIFKLQKLITDASVDSLTNALTRRVFDIDIERAHKDNCYMCLVDVDKFKQINDSLGHPFGDEVLVDISNKIMANDGFTLYRLGGDEFAILINNSVPRKKVISELTEILSTRVGTMIVTCSLGCARADEASNCSEWIHLADKRLYESKKNGRGKLIIN